MNSPFFLQSELGRAQAQLAESFANLPASSPIGAETESCGAIAAPGGHHLMKSCFASAANRHGFERAGCQGWANIRSETC
jgi:hypothetical protein